MKIFYTLLNELKHDIGTSAVTYQVHQHGDVVLAGGNYVTERLTAVSILHQFWRNKIQYDRWSVLKGTMK